jgi:predicted membrane-bound mannosyltransferase
MKGQLMTNVTRLIAVAGVGVSLVALAKADEVIQFTTLPQVVQSSVIRETRIASPTKVVRVVQDTGGEYAVTYMGESGQQVIYVSPNGAILQAPTSTVRETTTTTTTEQPSTVVTQGPNTVVESTGAEAVVTTQEVQQAPSRYELIEKKGNKEVYLDHQTGRKVKVERK